MKIIKVSQVNHSIVKAKDYFQLMRELEQGNRNLALLNKMIWDLEPAIMAIAYNTQAMGHTASPMRYPCPDCNSAVLRLSDMLDGEIHEMYFVDKDQNGLLNDEEDQDRIGHVDLSQKLQESEWGVFVCENCSTILTSQEVEALMKDNTVPRGIMITDEIERIWDLFNRIQRGRTFEEKFPYFEAIIEYIHRSGPIGHWFIEGGQSTIDKYRGNF